MDDTLTGSIGRRGLLTGSASLAAIALTHKPPRLRKARNPNVASGNRIRRTHWSGLARGHAGRTCATGRAATKLVKNTPPQSSTGSST